MKSILKYSIAFVLGLIYMWFILSFGWSLDDMSLAERTAGVIYIHAMIPMYDGIKKMTGLR